MMQLKKSELNIIPRRKKVTVEVKLTIEFDAPSELLATADWIPTYAARLGVNGFCPSAILAAIAQSEPDQIGDLRLNLIRAASNAF